MANIEIVRRGVEVTFGLTHVGEVFENAGVFYLKTLPIGERNAVCLGGCNQAGRHVTFGLEQLVVPCRTAQLHVTLAGSTQ